MRNWRLGSQSRDKTTTGQTSTCPFSLSPEVFMFDFRNNQWQMSAVLTKVFLFLVFLIFAAVIAPNSANAQTVWTAGPDSDFQFWRFDGEFSPATGKVYFLGGRETGGTNTNGRVWSFDPVTGAYADTGVDMPVPVSNYTIARVTDASANELLMIFGGRDAGGVVVNTVQGYNPVTNTTVDLTATDPYPEVTSPGAVVVVGNKAYSFGGFDAVATTAGCHIFDITAADGARWTSCPDLTVSRSYIAAGVVDGVIYAVGGDTWDGAALNPQTIAEKLDTANPTAWDDASVADLPLPCDENRGFGFDTGSGYDLAGKVIVAGCGQWPNSPSELAESLSYDPVTNTWDQSFPDLIQARRNHAGVFIPDLGGFKPEGIVTGTPGMWVFGGRMTDDNTILATPEYFQMSVVTPPCLYSNDFNDATMEWIEEKPSVTQPGDGFLHLTPLKKKAIAVADASFTPASTGTYTFDVQFSGGTDPKNWIYLSRIDKKNQLEVLLKIATGKVVVKDRNGSVLAKTKADFTFAPSTPYQVVINYDGTNIDVTINGTPLITDFVPSRPLPAGNIGAAAKDNSFLIDNVCVN
jgi:hypothetical protein